jgi:predicted transcriptional regulator
MEKPVKFPNLVAEMARKGDTQEVLAKLLNLTQASISRKLKGETGWSLKEVEIICDYYKKNYYELFK